MTLEISLQSALETEEVRTVSNSFGGAKCEGRTPSYNIGAINSALTIACTRYPQNAVAIKCATLSGLLSASEYSYLICSAIRFSFLIELTNLSITSTKLKTRWYPGKITKTMSGTFQNYEAEFLPGNDQRASSFDVCFNIFLKILTDVAASPSHIQIVKALSKEKNRSVSYECVFTYENANLNPVHIPQNVCLVSTADISWLVQYRNIIHPALTSKNISKIITKTYLTDRAQTGADQTNRAKRWEVLSADFQHASIEECWSVERKLLSQLLQFINFPQEIINAVHANGNSPAQHLCPITLSAMDFNDFLTASEHGRSSFQVGHLSPLKNGGRHIANNVAWVTQDGNRIQGDLTLDQTHALLNAIYARRVALGLNN